MKIRGAIGRVAILCLAIQWSAQIACGDAPAEVGRFWRSAADQHRGGEDVLAQGNPKTVVAQTSNCRSSPRPMRRWPPIVPC